MASFSTGLNRLSIITLLLMPAVVFCTIRGVGAQSPFPHYDLAMFRRPQFSSPERVREFSDGLKELWLEALQRPDAELQRAVIDTLAIAHRRGVADIAATQEQLVALMEQPRQPIDVLRAIAATLVEFDSRGHQAALAALARRHGMPVAQIVEPALASWKSTAMEDDWLRRVSANRSGQTMMLLAINGLRALRCERATEPLETIVRSESQSMGLRIAAARALGQIGSSGTTPLASQLLASSSDDVLSPILVIELLSEQEDAESKELLSRLSRHAVSAVQSRALEQLLEVDSLLVDQQSLRLLTSNDVNVRRWTLKGMLARRDSLRIEPICRLLGDVNPTLRRDARDGLLMLAENPDLRADVIRESMQVLNGNQWQGCEQACVVLARLDHEQAGSRMVELLGHQRGDVQVAAAWGLSLMQVEALLPEMLDHVGSVLAGVRAGQLNGNAPAVSHHVAHLFIAFGDQGFKMADPMLREYLPKNLSLGEESRAAAAWAVGMLYEDEVDAELASVLEQRLADVEGTEPELDLVRYMCALSLGRMRAESALGELRKYAFPSAGVSGACSWAVERITGEQMPVRGPGVERIDDWFLAPLSDDVAEE